MNFDKIPEEFITREKVVVTHDGPFQADDVFACAVLRRWLGPIKFVRTRNKKQIEEADIVVDVGGVYDPEIYRFDHHQNSYEGSKSSVGMVVDWIESIEAISSFIAAEIRSMLTDEIDDADTNGTKSAMSLLIWSMNPKWTDNNPNDFDRCFSYALQMAGNFLDSLLMQAYAKELASSVFDNMVKEQPGSIVVARQYLPDLAFEIAKRSPSAKFVVYEMKEKQWMAQCIPPLHDRTSQRVPYPEAIAGLRAEELEAVVGDLGSKLNPTAPFVHKGRFTGGAATREGAIALAEYVLSV